MRTRTIRGTVGGLRRGEVAPHSHDRCAFIRLVHKYYLTSTRREVFTAAASATAALALGARPASAKTPSPQGDDVAFLTFAGVAEGVAARCYGNSLRLSGAWSRAEKGLLREAGRQHLANVTRINAGLEQQDLIHSGAFERVVPVTSRATALATAIELEALLTGAYLDGLIDVADPVTRLLLGRMLAASSRNRATFARIAGHPLGGMPGAIDLDVAGERLDKYIKEPS